MVIYRDVWAWHVGEVAGDSAAPSCRGAAEEFRAPQHVVIDEDATQSVGKEVRAQQLVGVDDGVPGLACWICLF